MNDLLLEKPRAYFGSDLSNYARYIRHCVSGCGPLCWELCSLYIMIRSGKGILNVNQRSFAVEENTLCVLHSRHIFSFCSDGAVPLEMDIIIEHPIIPSQFDSLPQNPRYIAMREYGGNSMKAQCIKLEGDYLKRINRDFAKYKQESEECRPGFQYILSCISQRIMYTFYLEILPSSFRRGLSLPYEPLCSKIFDHIFCYNPKNLSLNDVLEKFGITKHELNLQLHSLCGSDFSFVKQRSMISFSMQLMHRNIPYKEIAAITGFTSQSTFIRNFHNIVGLSPNEYKESLREIFTSINSDTVLAETHHFIHENFRNSVTIEDCANRLFVSPTVINKRIKSFYGESASFYTLLNTFRLLYAESLLLNTDMKIDDIAIYSGFNSNHTFIRLFKKRFSYTPKEYQSKMNNAYEDDVKVYADK